MFFRRKSSRIEEQESGIQIKEVFSIPPVIWHLSCIKCNVLDGYFQRKLFLACGHFFHYSCIRDFQIGSRFQCPICRIVGYGYDVIAYGW
ncbi:hypothetical protein TNIN_175261 [Trichonephila inaurata madagascariensis]|uniref:RING-type domain-containing protein n=1 Tax=Trichonephila inaurata madagascariensis TaxID=2747483 RepID=A0A8X6XHP1_9ARAC|nr:hypothetical protein TNIN_175261 [Trichonephila inaurata madagascariensis]